LRLRVLDEVGFPQRYDGRDSSWGINLTLAIHEVIGYPASFGAANVKVPTT
jgi:hypothetical protein